MKRLLFVLVVITASWAHAQDVLTGTVSDAKGGNKLPSASVTDITTKDVVHTDKSGNFSIKTETGHILIVNLAGYTPDTLFLVDMSPQKVELKAKTIALKEVNVVAEKNSTIFNSRAEFPEVYTGTRSKLFPMSPTSVFSKERKSAKRARKYFASEEQERYIDQVYTRAYVGRLVPLKGAELQNFMALYRPSYAFLQTHYGPLLTIYINDCYKKYQALPPEKRVLPELSSE